MSDSSLPAIDLPTPALADHERIRAAATRLLAAANADIPGDIRRPLHAVGVALHLSANLHEQDPCGRGGDCDAVLLADILLGNRAG